MGPAPITAAITTSRAKPVTRETRVQPPTERMERIMDPPAAGSWGRETRKEWRPALLSPGAASRAAFARHLKGAADTIGPQRPS